MSIIVNPLTAAVTDTIMVVEDDERSMVGADDGVSEGYADIDIEGFDDGFDDGSDDGTTEGSIVGSVDGIFDGKYDGDIEGTDVG